MARPSETVDEEPAGVWGSPPEVSKAQRDGIAQELHQRGGPAAIVDERVEELVGGDQLLGEGRRPGEVLATEVVDERMIGFEAAGRTHQGVAVQLEDVGKLVTASRFHP